MTPTGALVLALAVAALALVSVGWVLHVRSVRRQQGIDAAAAAQREQQARAAALAEEQRLAAEADREQAEAAAGLKADLAHQADSVDVANDLLAEIRRRKG